MEEQSEVFVYLSPEIQKDLADNGTDLISLLNEADVEVAGGTAKDPTKNPDSGEKGDPVTVILASATVIAVLTPTILKLIEALSYRAVIVHEVVAVPVTDSKGDVVRDSAGEPVLQRVRRSQLLEPTKSPIQKSTHISIKFLGFEFEYGESPKE